MRVLMCVLALKKVVQSESKSHDLVHFLAMQDGYQS